MADLDKLKELNLTQDEIKRFTDAMKKPEFKELLFEYAKEISDPENRARYEMEIREMENERGMDVKFINPEPGYVIKTTIGGNRKAFINVCKNQHIGKPSSTKQIGGDGRPGCCWSLPHSFSPPREDVSKTGTKCNVYDFIVHPDTYRMAETNPRFKSMVNDTALEGIKKMFDVDVDNKNLKFPKIKYKGNPTSSVIRSKLQESRTETLYPDNLPGQFAYPYDTKTSEEKAKEIMERNEKVQASRTEKEKKEDKRPSENEFIVPKYLIKYQSNLDIQDFINAADARNATVPKNLIIEVDLPLLQSANPITLDVFEKRLSLVSHNPAKYRLDIGLSYPVDENEGSAKFDKNKRKLIVTLPVVPDESIQKLPFDGKTFEDNTNGDEFEDNKSEGEINGIEFMKKTEQLRPLIEVISEKDPDSAVKHSDESANGDQTSFTAANNLHPDYGSVVYLLPDFECQQDDLSLLFTFGTKKVRKESLLSTVLSQNTITVKMTSIGSGGFPVYYSCFLKFEDDCYIDINNCPMNFSEEEIVSLLVTKDSRSNGQWKSYFVGVNMTQLEERYLEIKTRFISADSTNSASSSNDVIEPDVNKVIHQNQVMGSEIVKPEGISTEMKIAVVQERGSPELLETLKQYSASESSDTSDSALTIHGQTTTSRSKAEDVQIDRTVFNENRSVGQMQSSVRNEQRNFGKCEKQEQRNSDDGSVDSGEDQRDGQSMEDVTQKNKTTTISDTVLVSSQLGEIESAYGRTHVSGNYSDFPSDICDVREENEDNVRNNISFAGGLVGENNCDKSAEEGVSHDCKTAEGESIDSAVSQLNPSAENDESAEKHPEDVKPAAIPCLSESQKSTSASVNIERKANVTTVEIKNKFVFDLDVD